MSPFTRTNSGLSNLNLFYSVDLVVFTEGGGNSLSENQVLSGIENRAPADIKFWKLVLDKNGLNRSYVLKAIGSKTSVRNIATKIAAGDVTNIAAAMDRDFDDYSGELLDTPLVLYTERYSWESDVYTKSLTKGQIAAILMMEPLVFEVEAEIDSAYAAFEKAGSRIARTEMIFRSQGIPWISEARGDKFFRQQNGGILDCGNLRKSIQERKDQLIRPAYCPLLGGVAIDPYRSNCGKLLRALSVAVIRYICKKYAAIKTLQNDVITAFMLERFGRSDQDVRSNYYSGAVAQLNAALS